MEPLDARIVQAVCEEIVERGNPELARTIRDGRWVLVARPSREELEIRFASPAALQALADAEGNPGALGEPWGSWDGTSWRPSLEAAVRIGGRARSGRVVVNDQASQLFLYARQVFGPNILDVDRSLGIGDVAWVCNEALDVLGLATIVARWDHPGPVLEPVIDLGWYLRQGG